jgi:hypothetical protein
MPIINFADDGEKGPSLFVEAGAAKLSTITTPVGNVILSGGVFLGDATNLPADESVVYGTGDTSVGADPSLSPTITILFPKPVSDVSFNLLNGEPYVSTYTVEDNLGDEVIPTLFSNNADGETIVSLNFSGITSITVSAISLNWDFEIDNISFNPLADPLSQAKDNTIPNTGLALSTVGVAGSVAGLIEIPQTFGGSLVFLFNQFFAGAGASFALETYKDPFDPNYQQEFFPTFASFPTIEPDALVPQSMANDANTMFANASEALGYLDAVEVTTRGGRPADVKVHAKDSRSRLFSTTLD